MRQQMRAFGWLTWLAGPRKHRELSRQRRDLQRQLQHMTRTVDDFAKLLGPRNWVFHSKLPIDDMAALVRDADPREPSVSSSSSTERTSGCPSGFSDSGECPT
jgi:hypothetical protein